MAIRRIALNTGGGDAPGLNGVIRAVTLSAHREGWEVIGIREGYRGLIEEGSEYLTELTPESVRGIMHLGGSMLGTTSRGDPHNYPVKVDGVLQGRDLSQTVIQRFRELQVDALVALGGDGSMGIASRLLTGGLPRVIGVPKTIDNDLKGTDVTFGFETAVTVATEAIDRLHTTAQAHRRVMVVEVMGRNAGWIALHAGISGGADAILIPEIPFKMASLNAKLQQRYDQGREFAIVVVAEGAHLETEGALYKGEKDAFKQHGRLGGISERLMIQINQETGLETRNVVLGHIQRGGSPVAFDRLLAQRLGCAATGYLRSCDDSGMVARRGGVTELVPFSEVTGGTRTILPDNELMAAARSLGVCFGDEVAGTFSA